MNFRFGFLLTLGMVCLSVLKAYSQIIHTPFHQRIDLNKGIPSDVVYEISQDKSGRLWLASEKGVFSYNGFSYASFQIEQSNYYTNDVINVKIDYLNRPVALDFSRYLFIIDHEDIISKRANNSIPKLESYSLKIINYASRSLITDGVTIYELKKNNFKKIVELTDVPISPLHDFYRNEDGTLNLLYGNGIVITYDEYKKSKKSLSKYPATNYSQYYKNLFAAITNEKVVVHVDAGKYEFDIPENLKRTDIYQHSFMSSANGNVYGLFASHLFIVTSSSGIPSIKWHYIGDVSTLSSLLVTQEGTIFISTLGDGLYYIYPEWLSSTHITYNTNSKIISYNQINGEDIAYQKRRIYFYQNHQLVKSVPVREDVLISNILYFNGHYFAAGNRFLFKIPEAEFKNINEYSYSTLGKYAFSNEAIKDIAVFENEFYYSSATSLVKYGLNNIKDTLIRNRCEKIFVQKGHLFVNTEEYIKVYNKQGRNIYNLNLRAKSIASMDSNNLIILSKTNDLFVFNISTSKLTPINHTITKSMDDILWYKNYLYVCTSEGILKLNYFEHNNKASVTRSYKFEHYDMELIRNNDKFILSSNRGVMQVSISDFFKKSRLPNYLSIVQSNAVKQGNTYHLNKENNHVSLRLVDKNLSCQRFCAILNGDTTYFKSGDIQLGALEEGNNTIDIIGYDRFENPSKKLSFVVQNNVPLFKSNFLRYTLIGTVATMLFLIIFATYRYRLRILQVENSSNKKEMETRLVALRSQMNPHFIYNVLNTAQSNMFSNKISEANNIITKLSHIIREVLESTKTRYIDIAGEIDLITEYCELEQVRYDNKFQFSIVVDPNLNMNYKIPYFFVQPLVENAIWHGLIKDVSNKNRMLKVSFLQLSDGVKILVDDNGVGYDPAKVREGSVALNNLNERIEIKKRLRKIESFLTIMNKKDTDINEQGTLVELIIKMPNLE